MIIECISDLHGHYPELEDGDLLIVAGDLTYTNTTDELRYFSDWMIHQKYKKKIFIGGNHDNLVQKYYKPSRIIDSGKEVTILPVYLCDSGTEFEGLKIWGSPWTKRFKGMNPKCMAFTCETEEELAEKWSLIPNDIDILITHSPPYDILDELTEEGKHAGSTALENVIKRIKPKLHVFGHIHEGYGTTTLPSMPTKFVNASHVNERYQPVNKTIRVIL